MDLHCAWLDSVPIYTAVISKLCPKSRTTAVRAKCSSRHSFTKHVLAKYIGATLNHDVQLKCTELGGNDSSCLELENSEATPLSPGLRPKMYFIPSSERQASSAGNFSSQM